MRPRGGDGGNAFIMLASMVEVGSTVLTATKDIVASVTVIAA